MEHYEFFLPNVDIGLADEFTFNRSNTASGAHMRQSIRDIIPLTINNHLWKLRRPVEFGGELVPADTAFHQATANNEIAKPDPHLKHALLEVPTAAMSLEAASQEADEITWLLSLAFGQKVSWANAGIRKDHHRKDLRSRSVAIPIKATGSPPLSNNGSGVLQQFMTKAYPIFKKDQAWWKATIHWFVVAWEASIVEVAAFIHSMLLDRISSAVLKSAKHEFGYLIGDDLYEVLSKEDSRKTLSEDITSLMNRSAKAWTNERSDQLIKNIETWNEVPSYPKKVATAFGLLGLEAPSDTVTGGRHGLMHTGTLRQSLTSNRNLFSKYDDEIHGSVIVLLLTMLKHEGRLFVPGRRDCAMTDFKKRPNA